MTMAGRDRLPLTAVVLTYNEERNLEKCLASIAGHAAQIVVVDSFSTDGTIAIAERHGAEIVQHAYEGHPQQWHWTLGNAAIANDWVFAIDADFVVTPALWDDLRRKLAAGPGDVDGYYVRHRQIFRGRTISHGGAYPNHWLRIFRRGKARVDLNELVDIHFYVDGKVGTIEFDVEERNFKDDDIAFWIQKQNNFARKQAVEESRRKAGMIAWPAKPDFFGTPDQRKLFLKSIWFRLPLYVRPFLYFIYRYVLRLGFLDGKEGFVYHYTQGFLYRLLVDINLEEILRDKKALREK
jgi:glycosyltransferase involved in cell wall biosynthesis